MQVPYAYSYHSLEPLRISVSSARLRRYLVLAKGDTAQALRLYMWNTALSEALYGPLQGLEITLRNKIHRSLSVAFGACWYDAQGLGMRHVQQEHVDRAKRALGFQGKPLEPDRLVAELSFGFWVGLFGPKYETHLWRPHFRKLLVNSPTPFLRKQAHAALDQIRLLRNRVAHHEPILHRRLAEEHQLILESIGWLCATTAAWVAHHSRFQSVYASRP